MKEIIQTDDAPKAIGSYSQAVKVGNTVYLSGQIPLSPQSMELISPEFEAQLRQVFLNVKAVCETGGGDLSSLVKLNVYLTDLSNFSLVNKVMTEFFVEPYPARAAIEVSALPRNALVQVDGILVT
jgi:reactive intermediate/imine deaminase